MTKKDLVHNIKITEEMLRENLFEGKEVIAHAKRELEKMKYDLSFME